MRRRNDSSFNATQILKVAGLDKAKRTKILEKEIHTGVHEKVQGGYGKFQGTWIPYDRAVALAQQYAVYDDLKPLFLYNVSGSEANDTPTKEQAVAAQRKNSNLSGPPASNSNSSGIGKGGNSFYKSMSRQPSSLGRAYSTLTDADASETVGDTLESPTKKQKINHSGQQESISGPASSAVEIFEHDLNIENPNTPFTLEPLSGFISEFEHSKEVITQIFLNKDIDNSIDGESSLNNVELDVPIDELGHTALHWASSLARIPLVKELIRRGAIRIRGNNNGESPLVRSVLVTNNYDQGSFDDLLNLLYPCIPLLDHQRRSILHHIALTAGIKKRSSASRYYLETLLEWIVKRSTSFSKGAITLGKFMNDIVNSQDKNGDTPLNIAARIGNKAIMQQLLDVGADPSIPNKAGLRPIDFGININGLSSKKQLSSQQAHLKEESEYNNQSYSTNQNGQSSSKILESMHQVLTRLDSDFQSEIDVKQQKINELHLKLRKSTVELSQNRKILESLKDMDVQLNELKQKNINIEKSIGEEEDKFLDETTELGSIGNYDVDFDADEPFRILPIYDFFIDELQSKKRSKSTKQLTTSTNANANTLRGAADNKNNNNNNSDSGDAEDGEDNGTPPLVFEEQDIDNLNIEYNNQQIDASTLPPPIILRARIKSYKENQEFLESFLNGLKNSSDLLESKFRRVVSLCTGVPEDRIDDILDGLVQAVESDPDEVDMGRVVGFLRKVDDNVEE